MTRRLIIPIFVPHQGCPHTCVFCNQRKITGDNTSLEKIKVRGIVDSYLETWRGERKICREIAFYGGSFSAIDDFNQDRLLSQAYEYKKNGEVDEIRLSTRPDYIDEKVIERFKRYSVDTVELGVQSFDDLVLKKSNRGHSEKEVKESLFFLKKNNFKVGVQLMVGLPGDSEEKTVLSTKRTIELKPDFVRIYPTVVVKDTVLAELYEKGTYVPWNLEKAIMATTNMVVLFYQAEIPVIRIGLQSSDEISWKGGILAGPYHPAFGEMVKSRIWLFMLKYVLSISDLCHSEVVILSSYQDFSQIIGQKKCNKEYLQKEFSSKKLIFKQSELIRQGEIVVESGLFERKYSMHDFITSNNFNFPWYLEV